MNSQVKTADLINAGLAKRGDTLQLPAGSGIALAVLIGSVLWMGIFALIM